MRISQTFAARQLRSMFPQIGPWTSVALWHDLLPEMPAPPTTPLAAELDVICGQRLAALLLRYLRQSDTEVSRDDRETLQRAAFVWTGRTVRALSGATEVVTDLRREGVALAVSKGPGIARFYPTLECRPFSDIDVIADSAQFEAIAARLRSQGWFEEDRNRQPWEFLSRTCREGLNLVELGTGAAIDLHHRLPPWIWSERIDMQAMVARAETVTLGATTYPCLSAADNLVVAALHLVSDHNRPGQTLIVWRDVVQLARQIAPARAAAIAQTAGVDGWLACVLDAIPVDVGTAPLRSALRAQAPLHHALRLSLLLSRHGDRLGVLGTQMLRLPLYNALAFAAGMLMPSPAFLARRYPASRWRYLRWLGNGPRRLIGAIAPGRRR